MPERTTVRTQEVAGALMGCIYNIRSMLAVE